MAGYVRAGANGFGLGSPLYTPGHLPITWVSVRGTALLRGRRSRLLDPAARAPKVTDARHRHYLRSIAAQREIDLHPARAMASRPAHRCFDSLARDRPGSAIEEPAPAVGEHDRDAPTLSLNHSAQALRFPHHLEQPLRVLDRFVFHPRLTPR
jgi:hypothetical protein